MDSPVQTAIEWTRVQLGPAQRAFLAGLPLKVEQSDILFVHADATAPRKSLLDELDRIDDPTSVSNPTTPFSFAHTISTD